LSSNGADRVTWIRFAGFGGQGVVLCGFIFGKAAMLDGKNSIHTQSYGSASRGGLTRSDVGIAAGEIFDLTPETFDVLVAMSQPSYDRFAGALAPEGLLFHEADLVRTANGGGERVFGLQATDIAHKEFGLRIIANMLMMGFVNEIGDIVSYDSLARTIRESVPPGTEDKNIRALEEGMRRGAEAKERRVRS
jgi:2-oxoglutarate ferredoxin oxidoreductase subunit gamma